MDDAPAQLAANSRLRVRTALIMGVACFFIEWLFGDRGDPVAIALALLGAGLLLWEAMHA